MSTSQRHHACSLLQQANAIPPTFHQEVQALLKEKSIDKVDLDIISGYLKSVSMVCNTKSYRRMKKEGSREYHCVRCHEEFTKDTNNPSACVVPHVFNGDDYRRVAGYGLQYKSQCCGGAVTVVERTPGKGDFQRLDRLGKCFVGYHTTAVAAVRYNGVNIRPCMLELDGDCVEFIGDNDNEPVFKY